jgi:hypothetical protein
MSGSGAPAISFALLIAAIACGEVTRNELSAGDAEAGGAAGSGGIGGSSGSAGQLDGGASALGGAAGGGSPPIIDAGDGATCPPPPCTPATCQGKLYACGDCTDNDGDGRIDADDPACTGPCDNDEVGYANLVPDCFPGAGPACHRECFFDQDCGSGNDQCFWSSRCDQREPEGLKCAYDPAAPVLGTPASCAELMASQSDVCNSVCVPQLPNGCDCFGCCEVPGLAWPVWLNSHDLTTFEPTCNPSSLADPAKCRPCTIVPSCFNPCDECELCFAKPALDPSCGASQKCPQGAQACGLPCQPSCPAGQHCLTGCCATVPS